MGAHSPAICKRQHMVDHGKRCNGNSGDHMAVVRRGITCLISIAFTIATTEFFNCQRHVRAVTRVPATGAAHSCFDDVGPRWLGKLEGNHPCRFRVHLLHPLGLPAARSLEGQG